MAGHETCLEGAKMEGHGPWFWQLPREGSGSLAGGLDSAPEPAFGGHASVPAVRSASREACSPTDVPCRARSP